MAESAADRLVRSVVRNMNTTAEAKRPVEVTARRVGLPDLFKHGTMMVERLMVKYPEFTKDNALGKLRVMADDSRNFFFVINEGGIACFEQTCEDMHVIPVVIERFVFAFSEAYQPVAAVLYNDVYRWAQSIGARELIVERFTDVPRHLIRKATAPLFTREVAFARIERKV